MAAFAGSVIWLQDRPSTTAVKLDIPGIVLASTGLFGLVYGFSHAETGGWTNSVTLSFIGAGVVLLAAFVVLQTRVSNPTLPLRVVLDRNRGGSYLAIFSAGAGMFGVFLFLTYYLQTTLNFSAVKSGLAFLPMTAALMVAAQIGTNVLTQRVGPRWIIAPGLAIASVGLWMLTHLTISSDYSSGVLPATIVFGVGVGLTFSSAMNRATAGVLPEDAGVASAMVSTGQQVGGSIGTALLSTLAASAATSYAHSHLTEAGVARIAAIHSYTTAFGWSALILGTGAVLTAIVLRGEVPQSSDADQTPALV